MVRWTTSDLEAYKAKHKQAIVGEHNKAVVTPRRRVKQKTKPLLNKLESEWLTILKECRGDNNFAEVRSQAIRFQLCNGVTFTPDLFSFAWIRGEPHAWEVKGKHAWDDAIVKIKMAAQEWPEIKWILVWKSDDGLWREQEILP